MGNSVQAAIVLSSGSFSPLWTTLDGIMVMCMVSLGNSMGFESRNGSQVGYFWPTRAQVWVPPVECRSLHMVGRSCCGMGILYSHGKAWVFFICMYSTELLMLIMCAHEIFANGLTARMLQQSLHSHKFFSHSKCLM